MTQYVKIIIGIKAGENLHYNQPPFAGQEGKMDTLKDIQDHPNMNWNWFSVSGNPNLTWEFILDNPTLHWKWGDVCGPCISNNTMKEGKKHWINDKRLKIIKALQIPMP